MFKILGEIVKSGSKNELLVFWENLLMESLHEAWLRKLCEGKEFSEYLHENLILPKIIKVSGVGHWDELSSHAEPIGEIVGDFETIISHDVFEKCYPFGDRNLAEVCNNLCSAFGPRPSKNEIAGAFEEIKSRVLNSFDTLSEVKRELRGVLWRLRGYISMISASKILSALLDEREGSGGKGPELRFNLKSDRVGENYLLTVFARMIYNGTCFRITDSWKTLLTATKEIEAAIKKGGGASDLRSKHFWGDCIRYLKDGRGEKCVKEILSKLCSVPSLKDKGDRIKDTIKELSQEFLRLVNKFPGDDDAKIFHELFNLMVLQHGVLEYQVFELFANSGLACLPRVEVTIREPDAPQERREIDLMVFSHDFSDGEIDLKPSACVEVTMSDKKEKLEEDANKLRRVINYLEEKVFPSAEISGIIVTPNFIQKVKSEE